MFYSTKFQHTSSTQYFGRKTVHDAEVLVKWHAMKCVVFVKRILTNVGNVSSSSDNEREREVERTRRHSLKKYTLSYKPTAYLHYTAQWLKFLA